MENADKNNALTVYMPDSYNLSRIIEMVRDGVKPEKMLEVLEKKHVHLDNNELIELLIEAMRYYANIAAFNPDVELGLSIERLHNLYSKAYRVQDFKTCLAIEKEKIKLMQLGAKIKLVEKKLEENSLDLGEYEKSNCEL